MVDGHFSGTSNVRLAANPSESGSKACPRPSGEGGQAGVYKVKPHRTQCVLFLSQGRLKKDPCCFWLPFKTTKQPVPSIETPNDTLRTPPSKSMFPSGHCHDVQCENAKNASHAAVFCCNSKLRLLPKATHSVDHLVWPCWPWGLDLNSPCISCFPKRKSAESCYFSLFIPDPLFGEGTLFSLV